MLSWVTDETVQCCRSLTAVAMISVCASLSLRKLGMEGSCMHVTIFGIVVYDSNRNEKVFKKRKWHVGCLTGTDSEQEKKAHKFTSVFSLVVHLSALFCTSFSFQSADKTAGAGWVTKIYQFIFARHFFSAVCRSLTKVSVLTEYVCFVPEVKTPVCLSAHLC